jgi:hypothetical protein
MRGASPGRKRKNRVGPVNLCHKAIRRRVLRTRSPRLLFNKSVVTFRMDERQPMLKLRVGTESAARTSHYDSIGSAPAGIVGVGSALIPGHFLKSSWMGEVVGDDSS